MKITDFIICEDIRNETGGKVSLMGVLGDNLNFNADNQDNAPNKDDWPKKLNLAAFVRVSFDEDDIRPTRFEFHIKRGDDKDEVIAGNMAGIDGKTKMLNMPVMLSGLPMQAPGILTFSYKLFSGETVLLEGSKSLSIATA